MALGTRVKEQAISQLRRLEWVQRLLPPKLVLRMRLALQKRLGALEPEFALLPLLTRRDKVSVDAGANVGVFTFALARLSAHVYAYEPLPTLAQFLTSAGLGNVTVSNVALSDHEGTSTIKIPIIAGHERATRASLELDGEHVAAPVRVTTLDSERLRDVGFVKIDVEGHEYRLLRGAAETVTRDRPNLLVEIEADRMQGATVDDVFALLGSWRYRGYFYDRRQRYPLSSFDIDAHQRARRGAPGYVNNFLFVPDDGELELPSTLQPW